MTASKVNRFLTDKTGSYDLASVSAIVIGGGTGSSEHATLVLDGGGNVRTNTAYTDAVTAWQTYLASEETAPAPAAP